MSSIEILWAMGLWCSCVSLSAIFEEKTVSDIIFDHDFTGNDLRQCTTCSRPAGDHQYSLPEDENQ